MHPIVAGFLKAILEASWQASVVIVLLMIIRPLLGKRVPARWRYILWALVFLRLLAPTFILPRSRASLQNVALVNRPFEQAGYVLDRTDATEFKDGSLRPQDPEPGDLTATFSKTPQPARIAFPWWRIMGALWLVGALLAAGWMFAGMRTLYSRLRLDTSPVEGEVQEIWLRCCAGLSVRRPPKLRATGCVESPALIGFFHPLLLIPKSALQSFAPEDWEHIFLHELAHYQRRDHWMQLLQLVALCAHWFNPLVWWSYRYLRVDRELAADEWALRHLGNDRSIAYGDTLVKVVSAQVHDMMPKCVVGIMEDGAQLKQRLQHIVAFGPRRVLGSIAGVGLALAMAAVVLGRQVNDADLGDYEGMAPADILATAARDGDKAVLEKMLADHVAVNGVAHIPGESTALAEAAASNRLDIMKLLLDHGADVNLKTEHSDSPVIAALKHGWLSSAEYLITRGAGCDAAALAAAKEDLRALDSIVTGGKAPYEQLNLLAEIAAANGQTEVFTALGNEIRVLPGKDRWQIGNGVALIAIARGHRGVVEEITAHGSDMGRGVTRFAPAAAQAPGMREWLEAKGFKVPDLTDGDRLIDATEREDLPEMRRLLRAGVDINFRDQEESGWTAISKAAAWGRPKAVRLLLEHGADPNAAKQKRWSALCLAKTKDIADMLFAAGADLKGSMGTTHNIDYCVMFGPLEMVKWYLDHGVDPTKEPGNSGGTLLFDTRSPEIAEILLEHGVDVKARNKFGETALHRILRGGANAGAVARVLLKHGADPNDAGPRGMPPLWSAEDGAAVDALVEAGADIHATSKDFGSVFQGNPNRRNASAYAALLKHGAKFDPKLDGPHLMFYAAERGNSDLVKLLLENGVDPNAGYDFGEEKNPLWWAYPLEMAATRGHYGAARLLLDHGATSKIALWGALREGHTDVARLLWERGDRSVSELCYAVGVGEPVEALSKLLEKGSVVDPPEDTIITPLGMAATLGQLETVKFLCSRGADLNRGQSQLPDMRPLPAAGNKGCDQVVEYLLSRGAKPDGKIAGEIAFNSHPYRFERPQKNFDRIMKMVVDAGALENIANDDATKALVSATLTRNPGGNPYVLEMLLSHGLKINVPSIGGEDWIKGKSLLDLYDKAVKAGNDGMDPAVKKLVEEARAKLPTSEPGAKQ